MVNEVEAILNEIRERVRADHEQDIAPTMRAVQVEADQPLAPRAKSELRNTESLNRLAAHLTTTARAWDRLPPIFSNRSGAIARLELWIKARLKSLTHWFTWEQVNFNAAVHHALVDTLEALSANEQELIRLRLEFARENELRRQEFERARRELQELRALIEAQLGETRRQALNHADALKKQGETLSAATQAHVEETRAAQAQINTRLTEMANGTGAQLSKVVDEINARLAELAADLREENRVCFRQLSLEASEAAVLEDRGRRAIESRLKQLEQPRISSED